MAEEKPIEEELILRKIFKWLGGLIHIKAHTWKNLKGAEGKPMEEKLILRKVSKCLGGRPMLTPIHIRIYKG
jgi:hypothetical protein